jgi:hypothetical protein
MPVMAKIAGPVGSGNKAVKDASVGKLIRIAADRWKQEPMYFGGFEGKRTALIVFGTPGLCPIRGAVPAGNEPRSGHNPGDERRRPAEGLG